MLHRVNTVKPQKITLLAELYGESRGGVAKCGCAPESAGSGEGIMTIERRESGDAAV